MMGRTKAARAMPDFGSKCTVAAVQIHRRSLPDGCREKSALLGVPFIKMSRSHTTRGHIVAWLEMTSCAMTASDPSMTTPVVPTGSDDPWAGLTAEELNRVLDEQRTVLNDEEIPWRDRQPLLQARGYALRPRYRPGWIASWTLNPKANPRLSEDYIEHPVSGL